MKKWTKAGCAEDAFMTSQLHHNFQASQVMHGADDVITAHFKSQVNSLGVCGPKLILSTTLPQ